VQVAVTPAATTVERVDQVASFVSTGEKQALLAVALTEEDVQRALVFTRTKHGADRVVKKLAEAGIDAAAIHGNKSQPQRERALAAFRAGRCKVLVATDIAARGVDVPGVSHVINFEMPNVPEQYVHRIGRTARAGASGLAISFVADDERPLLRDIEKLTRPKLTIVPLPEGFTARPVPAVTPARPAGPRPPAKPARPRRRSGGSRSGASAARA
jgi:ATP-dependent RNA helicase RhlE